MLSDSLTMVDGSVANNLQIVSGEVLPDGQKGELFYLTIDDIGLYLHNGTEWAKLGASEVEPTILGTLWAWGDNSVGSLGDGTQINKSSPIQVGVLTNWKTLFSNGRTGMASKTDDTLWGWGLNDSFSYQFGTGMEGDSLSPIQIRNNVSDWSSFSLLTSQFLVKTDGTLWAWGYNGYGQLGDNTIITRSTPVQIGSLTNWKEVAISSYGTVSAVKTNGTLWTWGRELWGQLGDNTVGHRSSPVQIGNLTNWARVFNSKHATRHAIKTDGTLWAWGLNDYGQLGDGTIVNKSSPVQIGTLTNWKEVSSGQQFTVAIKTDSTLWAWGHQEISYPLLGDGTFVPKSSPIQIGAATNWKSIDTGYWHTAAIKTDGTLWTWGNNLSYGQLGNGTTVSVSTPIQIGNLTDWRDVKCGIWQTWAIKN